MEIPYDTFIHWDQGLESVDLSKGFILRKPKFEIFRTILQSVAVSQWMESYGIVHNNGIHKERKLITKATNSTSNKALYNN